MDYYAGVKKIVYIVAGCAALAALYFRYQLLLRRFFDPDEFQHAHFIWALAQGLLPYRDFFEHHPPLYHALLIPLPLLTDPAAGFEAAWFTLLALRGVSLLLFLVLVLQLYRLANRFLGSPGGIVAVALLSTNVNFLFRSLEARPDALALIFWLGTLDLLLGKPDCPAPSHLTLQRRFWAGLCFGLALCTSQKLIYAVPGLVLFLWFVQAERNWRLTLSQLAYFCGGALLPGLALWGLFACLGAGTEFFSALISANFHWPLEYPYSVSLRKIFVEEWPHAALALLGCIYFAACCARRKAVRPFESLIVCAAASLLIGGFLIPVPYRQYYLPLLPLMALLEAGVLTAMSSGTSRSISAAGIAVVILLTYRLHSILNSGIFADNRRQAHELRLVMDVVRPGEKVIDEWTGLSAFRHSAWYFPFMHRGYYHLVDERYRSELLAVLDDPLRRPKGLLLNNPQIFSRLVPGFAERLRRHYFLIRGVTWVRREGGED